MPRLMVRFAAWVLRALPLYRLKGGLVYRSLLGRVRFKESEMDVLTVDGLMMSVYPNDFIGRLIYFTGGLDRHVVDVLVAHSRPGDVLWDVGANIGYVSVAFAHRVPKSWIVAVEPQAVARRLLERNLDAAAPDRHRIVAAAISDRCGEMGMDSDTDRLGMGRLSEHGAERVQVVTGLEVMAETGVARCDLIKIDVEGHELEVFKGLSPILSKARPRAIVFECHSEPARDQIAKLLADYTIYVISRSLFKWHITPIGEARWGMKETPDYLAVLSCPPKTDPPVMRVPSGPGWALETLDETDTTRA